MNNENIWMLCAPTLSQEFNGFAQKVKIAVYQSEGYGRVKGDFDLVAPIEQLEKLKTENADLKARLARVEGEYAKEQEVAAFYGNEENWDLCEDEVTGQQRSCIVDSDDPGGEVYGGKRATQRIKERKEFE